MRVFVRKPRNQPQLGGVRHALSDIIQPAPERHMLLLPDAASHGGEFVPLEADQPTA